MSFIDLDQAHLHVMSSVAAFARTEKARNRFEFILVDAVAQDSPCDGGLELVAKVKHGWAGLFP